MFSANIEGLWLYGKSAGSGTHERKTCWVWMEILRLSARRYEKMKEIECQKKLFGQNKKKQMYLPDNSKTMNIYNK